MAVAEMDVILDISMNKAWDLFDKPGAYNWQSDVFRVDVHDDEHFTEFHDDGRMTFTLKQRDFYDRLEYDVETEELTGHRIILFMEERSGIRIALMDEFKPKKLIGNPMLGMNMAKKAKAMEKDIKKFFK